METLIASAKSPARHARVRRGDDGGAELQRRGSATSAATAYGGTITSDMLLAVVQVTAAHYHAV